ncbi:MAG: CBS domain-containing protein [Myxococcales bacterium]
MKVSELMVKEVVSCNDTTALGAVAELMQEHGIGFLPVISSSDGTLVGVVTDRDGFLAAHSQVRSLWEIPVLSAMSSYVASVAPDADVGVAENIMTQFNVHRLPVVAKDGKLVGIVSISDIACRANADLNEEMQEEVAATLGAISQARTVESMSATGM